MKIILVTFSTLITILGFSQISINLSSTSTDVSGTIQFYELTESVTAHSMHYFDVINSSGNNLDLVVTRKIISETSGWSNFLCYGPIPFGTCYPANPNIIWSTNSETIVDTAIISTYVTAPTSGSAQYRYYISEDGTNYLDSVDIQVNSVADVNTLDFVDLQIFPNPANNFLNIKNSIPYRYVLMNNIGSVIFKSESESTIVKLNILGLPSGLYFLSLQSNESEITEIIQVK